ncbi:MAG TPA: YggU family protein [Thermococcaceae archaeon]|uniref:UPF0235 protein TSIB_0952 n=2 Tax=Thermococcus sibiricus TaxID=172049 RepID=C6A315_THESM|nr:DUF167 domain-containing protein [Thermococcus sibiricus]ACS90010.1 hypothetical protein TSIB_0952 [Thermococcus sibiricus MM 739]KUK18607.1 MAG: hypothetical protein XD54_0167 [Thermococcus sibiricus]KUK29383.1 MAG: hypothetical protein XD61_0029 [Thermococcus sp. 40_45]HII66697.1 YggU family protein [Thermococcaceae archaeon]
MIKESKEGVILQIYVQPKANTNEIEGVDEWRGRLKVKIKAPPVEGKANKEVVKFFSKLLGAEASLIKGETSREKDLLIRGISIEEVKKKLKIYR